MAPWAARKAKLVIKNLEKILGIELLLASRGIWITQDQLGEFKLGKGTSIAYEKVNEAHQVPERRHLHGQPVQGYDRPH